MAIGHSNAFLYTPQFGFFLNQMRESQPNNAFSSRWDFGQQYNNNNGFSYSSSSGESQRAVYVCSVMH